MRRLIQDLLNYSQIKDDSSSFEWVELKNMVALVKNDFIESLTSKQGNIKTETSCSIPVIQFLDLRARLVRLGFRTPP
jgi:hypothetical protein